MLLAQGARRKGLFWLRLVPMLWSGVNVETETSEEEEGSDTRQECDENVRLVDE